MRTLLPPIFALSLLFLNAPLPAQSVGGSVHFPGGFAPGVSPCIQQAGGACQPVGAQTPLPVAGVTETFNLVAANVPGAQATVFGGQYVVSQACATYGALTIRYRGPDGSTMVTLFSRSAPDSGGGTLISLAAGTVIDATTSGTTACNASLARVP
jgi:hypothetical protein